MRPVTDRVARGVGLASFLVASACGGSAFLLESPPPDDGGLLGASERDAGSDASAPELDSGTAPGMVDAAPSDAAPPQASLDASEAGHDAGPPDTGPPCASMPPVTRDCSTTLQDTFPGNVCIEIENDVADTLMVEATPAACATWCTFTCDCLVDSGVCPSGTTTISCLPRADGTINVVCVTPNGM